MWWMIETEYCNSSIVKGNISTKIICVIYYSNKDISTATGVIKDHSTRGKTPLPTCQNIIKDGVPISISGSQTN